MGLPLDRTASPGSLSGDRLPPRPRYPPLPVDLWAAPRAGWCTEALMSRRALILLDGIDEGGQARGAIELHIASVLVPQGHHILMTSRPAGVNEDSFDRALVQRLQLLPLTDAQQATVIEHRLGVSDLGYDSDNSKQRASELLEYIRERVPTDADGVRVTSNPLMLSMVISICALIVW